MMRIRAIVYAGFAVVICFLDNGIFMGNII